MCVALIVIITRRPCFTATSSADHAIQALPEETSTKQERDENDVNQHLEAGF